MAYALLKIPCTKAQSALLGALTEKPRDAREIAAQLGFGDDGTLKVRAIHGNLHKLAIRHGAPDPIMSERYPASDGTEQTRLWLAF